MVSPLERLGRPDEIAAFVAFLAGPNGGWVTARSCA
jgi:3-oxoacyl-[acyl-carrier protein] reductase